MRVGFHVSKKSVAGGKKSRKIMDAVPEDMQLVVSRGLSPIAQIFVCGPRTATETLTDEDKDWLSGHPEYPTVIHGAYIDHPWGESRTGINNIKVEMGVAAAIGATGVVVHLAEGAYDDEVFHRVIAQCAGEKILWLETQSAKPTAWTYETPEKLQNLCEKITPYDGTVGLCVDTAHLFACGADLTTREDAMVIFDVLDKYPTMPVMIHLNDSASTRGSGVDRHAGLCTGRIWGAYAIGNLPVAESGLAYIVNWANSRKCDVILERDYNPGGDLDIIRHLVQN